MHGYGYGYNGCGYGYGYGYRLWGAFLSSPPMGDVSQMVFRNHVINSSEGQISDRLVPP